MASMRCVCGTLMSNVDSPNDMELILFRKGNGKKSVKTFKMD
ncbi:conserved hypothetical protein [Paenibacillus curdlanolyticus YK9]|uniref:Uncharacterized protein n=1 Tax=Paenibacillus curdlanolyticus YK9 TaxID=717606 RepID=E0IFC2_9BACL|nr:conserved hypothetical protein [Paenibacillus curdlanolyticus YK9]